MTGPRIALEDLGSITIEAAEDLPGWHVVHIGGEVELEATLNEFENIAYNLLALVSGQRMNAYRQLGGGS